MKTKRILVLFLAVVTCLSLAVSASAASISDFKDVDTKAWYAEAATAAVDNGLLYGKSKTQLDPQRTADPCGNGSHYKSVFWLLQNSGHFCV